MLQADAILTAEAQHGGEHYRRGPSEPALQAIDAIHDWLQLLGAGALGGIGFTMSLFIAGQAFPVEADFAAAKIAVFAASTVSALIGLALLWCAAARSSAAGRDTPPLSRTGRPDKKRAWDSKK
jgi:hypothetical protein